MSGLGRMAGRVLGAVWPRGAAERFAARVFAGPDVARDLLLESALPLVGDDTFELDEAGVDLGDPVLSDFPGCNCAGARAADLMDHRPDCAARTGLRPAGECAPPTPPPAGHLDPPHVGKTPAAESEARSSAAGHPSLDVPLVVELLEPYEPAEFAALLRVYATELISPGRVLRLAALLDPRP